MTYSILRSKYVQYNTCICIRVMFGLLKLNVLYYLFVAGKNIRKIV